MNANELADGLNKILEDKSALFGWEIKCIKNAEAMLRQQQAEIEALKKEAALQRLSDFTQEADNEPVAWRWIGNSSLGHGKVYGDWRNIKLTKGELQNVSDDKRFNIEFVYSQEYVSQLLNEIEVLKAKTLTDEEIEEVYESCIHNIVEGKFRIDFAKAILKKANEK